ncbi:MAG: hypothetical protein AAGI01_10775 [Myxococcota bacterium]
MMRRRQGSHSSPELFIALAMASSLAVTSAARSARAEDPGVRTSADFNEIHEVVLKSGSVLRGTILERSNTAVRLKISQDNVAVLPWSVIASITDVSTTPETARPTGLRAPDKPSPADRRAETADLLEEDPSALVVHRAEGPVVHRRKPKDGLGPHERVPTDAGLQMTVVSVIAATTVLVGGTLLLEDVRYSDAWSARVNRGISYSLVTGLGMLAGAGAAYGVGAAYDLDGKFGWTIGLGAAVGSVGLGLSAWALARQRDSFPSRLPLWTMTPILVGTGTAWGYIRSHNKRHGMTRWRSSLDLQVTPTQGGAYAGAIGHF